VDHPIEDRVGDPDLLDVIIDERLVPGDMMLEHFQAKWTPVRVKKMR
jgi:hypothetical protein